MPEAVAPGDFRETMSRLASGVVMVTCVVDGRPWGVTISACCSASMDPPQVLVSLRSDTAATRAIASNQQFGLAILTADSLPLATFGAAPGQPKFIERFCRGPEEADSAKTPVPGDVIAHLDCTVAQQLITGDHTIFVGTVCSVLRGDGEAPLAYFARSFQGLTALASAR